MGKFSDLKDKIKKAANFPEDEDYIEEEFDDNEDDDEEIEDIQSGNDFSSDYHSSYKSYTPKTDSYKFDFEPSSSSYTSQTAKKSANKTSASSNGGNIYRMNNTSRREESTKVNRVLFFILEDAEDARNIADSMIKQDCVILADMSKISPEDCNRVLNFLDGVRYICKSQIENINGLQLIVPETIQLSGDFFNQVNLGFYSE